MPVIRQELLLIAIATRLAVASTAKMLSMADASVAMMAIQRVVPALRITNYERSKKFYLDQLGFILEWEHRFEPKFPVFMSVALDGMRLYLTEHSGDCQVGGLVHFVVSDVDALHDTFKKRQVPITEAPNDDLGFRNMTITDPDGNSLRFMEPSTKG